MVVNFTTWQFSVFYCKEWNKINDVYLFIYWYVDWVSVYTIDWHDWRVHKLHKIQIF